MVKTLILFFCGTAKARSLFEFLVSRQKSNGPFDFSTSSPTNL